MIIENQQKAIQSRNSNILLSASAGTGKTYTMVKRIISLLSEGADISQFLVLAFGNDASKEMKDRIESGIFQLATADKRYYPQLKKLKIASISTIHAFALEIAKTYFAVSGASPKAQVLLGAEEDVLKATAMEKVFLDLYEEGSEDFLTLVEYFIQGRKDDKLKADIFKLYTFSRNMPKGEFEKNFFAALDSGVLQSEYLKITKNKAQSILDSYLLSYPIHEIYQSQYNQCYDILKAVIAAGDIAEIHAISQIAFITKKSPKKGDSDSLKHACESFYTLVRDRVKTFIQKAGGDIAEGLETAGFESAYRDIAKKLFFVTSLFEAEYSKLKSQKDYVDFSDTEHMLLAVLKDEKSKSELNARFKYIFCDEYQDVSKIQEEILTLLSGSGNLFTVGDIKQNIYGFRACDQTVIKNRERNILAGGDGLLLPMNTNFRSHRDILEFVNSVFSAAMTNPDICNYAETSMFEAMADFPDLGGVEIAISKKIPPKSVEKREVYSVIEDKGAPREELNAEAEAGHIARFIRKYLGTQFDFPDGKRAVRLSDFAILLRKTTGNFAKTISRVLDQCNLPSFIVASESTLKSHTKVLFLADFLKTISCPFDDVALYSTLVSPFFDIPDSVLFEIRTTSQGKFFHECFFNLAKTVACKYNLESYPFSSGTAGVQDVAATANIPDMAATTLQNRDVFDVDFSPLITNFDIAATKTELAVAKFMVAHRKYSTLAAVSCFHMLKTAIADNCVREKVTLASGEAEWDFAIEFLNFIQSLSNTSLAHACEKLEKAGETLKFAGAGTLANAVSIMTMHKSKGLEFPFTIIAGTGSKYNEMDTRNTMLFHKDYGFAFPHRNLETRKSTNTFEKVAMKTIIKRDICDEELRLLYVALTRAKFKLLITGTLDCDFYIQDNLVVADKLPRLGSLEDFYAANTHLKIILAALAASKFACNYQITRILDEKEDIPTEVVDIQSHADIGTRLAARLLSLQKKPTTFEVVPTKFTATQRLEQFAATNTTSVEDADLQVLEKYEVGKIIDFATDTSKRTPNFDKTEYSRAEIGTNYHKILEKVPFYLTETEISNFVAEMIASGEIINFEYDIQKVFKLTNNRIFAGVTPHREVPFVMNMQSELFGLKAGTTLLCQGIIDCVFETPNGGLIIVDYKATTIKSHSILRKKYLPQLETYKIACEKILAKKVEKCYIYSIFFEELIDLQL